MKITGLKLGGIGCFYDDVTVPIEELGAAELVSIQGENGAGKSTALTTIPGALYRTMPGKGPVAALANRKDSFIELGVDLDGQEFKCRLMVDGLSKTPKSEAYIFGADGSPITSGKARDYDAEIARLFPSSDVYFASAFAAQGGEGRFLDLPASSRKQLFAKLLGLGRLEEMSEAAGKRAREADTTVAELRAQVQVLQRTADGEGKIEQDLAGARRELEAAQKEHSEAEAKATAARKTLDEWKEQASQLERTALETEARKRESEAKAEHLSAAVTEQRGRIAQLCGEQARLQSQLAAKEDLAKTAGRVDDLLDKLGDTEGALFDARKELEAYQAAMNAWRDAKYAAEKRAEDAYRSEVEEYRKEKHEAERALADAKRKYETAVSGCRSAVQIAKRDLEQAKASAAGLGNVPCGGEGDYAGCPLIQTATRARGKLDELERTLVGAVALLEKTEADNSDVLEAQWRDGGIDPEPVKPAVSIPSAPLRPEVDTQSLEARTHHLRNALATAKEAQTKLESLADVEERNTKLTADLAAVRAKIATLQEELAAVATAGQAATQEWQEATRAVQQHQALRPSSVEVDTEALRRAESTAAGEVARLSEALKAAQSAATEIKARIADIEAAVAEVDDWKHLQKALGRDGIQALEIDAAGPEVSDLCNSLLHACYGSRFSVSLETTALKADGKGTKEVFDLRVLDTERGTDGSADQLSGGEKVLVSEALSLAIAIYNARRSSVPMADLFRDECSGALSHGNAERYIEMLRKALDLGGFHRVYFVAHQPHLWALADASLVVADGQVRIDGWEPGETVSEVAA